MLDWLKTNWWKVLIIPVVFYFAYKLFRVFYVFITKRVEKPDLSSDTVSHEREIAEIKDHESKDIAKVDQAADAKKQGIDQGTPTPSEVFNEILKEAEKASKENKDNNSKR